MITLILTRHGETEENVQKILQGHLPGHLTANGRAQAETLRETFRNISFDVILCSDLQRAVDTASQIAKYHPQTPVYQTPLLRERDWGSFTGASIPEIQGKNLPADVETVDQLFERARRFFHFVRTNYPDMHILVVAHGLFNRVLLAALSHQAIRDIPIFKNGEYRRVELPEIQEDATCDKQETEVDN